MHRAGELFFCPAGSSAGDPALDEIRLTLSIRNPNTAD